MADRKDSDREVLTSLPRTRPVRRSTKRGERPAAAKGPATAQQPKPAATPRAASAATPRAAERKPPKTAAAGTSGARTAKQQRKEPPRVAPARKVPPAGYAAPTSRAGETPARDVGAA